MLVELFELRIVFENCWIAWRDHVGAGNSLGLLLTFTRSREGVRRTLRSTVA